jgi:hypothetical protein
LSDLSVNHPGEVGGEESLAMLREVFADAHADRIRDTHYRSGHLGDYQHDYE